MESALARRVTETLNELVDEETTRKFGELNLVTEVTEMAVGSVRIKFQPLSPYSPLAVSIGRSIREKTFAVEGVKSVKVECSGHMMDELVNRLVNGEAARPKPL